MVIVYGDFNCPYSYLASTRVNALVHAGLGDVEFRAVEHRQWLPVTGGTTAAKVESIRVVYDGPE